MKTLLMLVTITLLASSATAQIWYKDADGDNFGDLQDYVISVTQPVAYVPVAGDCDDSDASVNPGSSEICGNGIDEDCDGWLENGCTIWFFDADGDGSGDPFNTFSGPVPPAGYIAVGQDCDDSDSSINIFQSEICGDFIDNNCDGGIDNQCPNVDSDGDGLYDSIELNIWNTDPTLADTDGDGCSDFYETQTSGTDPNDPGDCSAVSNDDVSWGALKALHR